LECAPLKVQRLVHLFQDRVPLTYAKHFRRNYQG
jgi:hypothetical protein